MRFAANLILLPFIVGSLGNLVYGGLWVAISTLTLYLGLTDLGTSTAYVRFISTHTARQEWDKLNEVVNTGLSLYALLGASLCGIVLLCGRAILSLVGVPVPLLEEGETVLLVGTAALAVSQIGYTFASLLVGIHRMDLSSYVNIAVAGLNIAGTLIVLNMGWGVRGLMGNVLVMAAANLMLQAYFSFRVLPGLRISTKLAKSSRLKELVQFGYNLQVTKIAQLFVFQFDRLLSLRLFGPDSSTLYDIGARLNAAGRTLSSLPASALIPAVAHLEAQDEDSVLGILYLKGTRYAVAAAAFVFAYLFVFAGLLLRVWMGGGFEGSVTVVQILALGYFFNVASNVASSFLLGKGDVKTLRNAAILQAGVAVSTAVVCAVAFGRIGIAVGTAFSLIVGGLYLIVAADRIVSPRPNRTAQEIIKTMLAVGVAGLASKIILARLSLASTDRMESILILGGTTIVYAAISGILLSRTGIVSIREIRGLFSVSRSADRTSTTDLRDANRH